ncbi:hypothetical protein PGB90_003809 [Kerria lacca]
MDMDNDVPEFSSSAIYPVVQAKEQLMTPQSQDMNVNTDNVNLLGLGIQEDILKEEFFSCVLKYDIFSSDLEVSAAILEDVTASRDLHAVMAELKDIERLQEKHIHVHLQATRLATITGNATEERERLELQRKKFLIRLQNLRNVVIRVIEEAESVSNEVCSSNGQMFRLKLPKVEIQIFSESLDE